MHIILDESNAFSKEKNKEEDDDVGLEKSMNDLKLSDNLQPQQEKEENLVEGVQTNNGNDLNLPRDLHFSHAHPKNQILGDPLQGVKTKASLRNIYNNMAFLSQIEPKSFKEAEKDESWIVAMQE